MGEVIPKSYQGELELITKIGSVVYENKEECIFFACKIELDGGLSAKISRSRQYNIAKSVIRH